MNSNDPPPNRGQQVLVGTFYFVVAALLVAAGIYVASHVQGYVPSGDSALYWIAAALMALAGWVAAHAFTHLRRGVVSAEPDSPDVLAPPPPERARKVLKAELAAGAPLYVKSLRSEREMYMWVPPAEGWDGVNLPASARVLNVGFTWNQEESVTVLLTMDTPEHFDPMQVPAWAPPHGAEELILMTYEGEIIAHVKVPAKFREIHYSVKRDGVEPRVVIYLA